MGPCAGVEYNLTLCPFQSRLEHIYHGQPYARVDFITQSGTLDFASEMKHAHYCELLNPWVCGKAVNREDKRTRRVRDRDFVIFESLIAIAIATAVRKKSLAAVAPLVQFLETPPRRERDLDRCLRFATPPPHPPPISI